MSRGERQATPAQTLRRGVASDRDEDHTEGVTTTSLLGSILNWLRAGYPDGVPGPDRVPLLALLRATPLTEEQVKEVIANLTADRPADTADSVIAVDEIAAFISDVTHHDAGPENVQRVAARLAAAGWPLAGVEFGDHTAE